MTTSHSQPTGITRAAQCAILLIALVLSACVTVNVERSSHMPIVVSRLQTVGTVLVVEGVLTVASGALDGGFAVQDASGGIYVSRTLGAAVKAGDQVRVSGRIVMPKNQQRRPGDRRPLDPHAEKNHHRSEDNQSWSWRIYLDDGSGRLLVFVNTLRQIIPSKFLDGDMREKAGAFGYN